MKRFWIALALTVAALDAGCCCQPPPAPPALLLPTLCGERLRLHRSTRRLARGVCAGLCAGLCAALCAGLRTRLRRVSLCARPQGAPTGVLSSPAPAGSVPAGTVPAYRP